MVGAWATHWAGHAGGREEEGEDGGRGLMLMKGGVRPNGEEDESEEKEEGEGNGTDGMDIDGDVDGDEVGDLDNDVDGDDEVDDFARVVREEHTSAIIASLATISALAITTAIEALPPLSSSKAAMVLSGANTWSQTAAQWATGKT